MSTARRVFFVLGLLTSVSGLYFAAKIHAYASSNNFNAVALLAFGIPLTLCSLSRTGALFAGILLLLPAPFIFLNGDWLFGYWSEVGPFMGAVFGVVYGIAGLILIAVGFSGSRRTEPPQQDN